jgi:uncharacterized protein (TIGR02145 family)
MESKFLRLISVGVICLFIITTCKKDHGITDFEVTEVTVTDNSVKVTGKINSLSDSPISAYGVCYSTKNNPTATDTAVNLGVPKVGTFTASINNLKRNKTYYLKAFVKEGDNYLYDDIRSAVIAAIAPGGTSAAATGISESSATLNGNVNPNGCPASWAFEYGTTTSYGNTANPTQNVVTGESSTDVSIALSSLTSNTTYHFRIKITGPGGTVYGEDLTFKTSLNLVAPSVPSVTATNIANTSVTLNASVNPNGSPAKVIFEYGTTFLYGSEIAATPDSVRGVVPTSATASLTGLTPGTLYHFRVKAVSAGGTTNSDDATFTTTVTIPAVTTIIPSLISTTTAASGGNITDEGSASVIVRGVCWNTTGNPTISDSKTENGSGAGFFASGVTGLNPSTQYYLRAYATSSAGTAYGEQAAFTTLTTNPQPPTVTTSAVTDITAYTATGGGNVTSDGGNEVVYRGICYGENHNPTIDDSKTINGTGTGTFTSPCTGLTPNTLYYVRAYATNAGGTSYGNEVSFTSSAPPAERPQVTTANVTAITYNTSSSGGNVISDGGATVTARGVCWSTAEYPDTDDPKTVNGSGTGAYTSSVTGLSASTIYYIRAYATNSAGTSYGDQISFTTSDPPAGLATLTTTAISDITKTSASSGGNITNDGGGAITSRGVCWKTSPGATLSDPFSEDGNGSGSFVSLLSGLDPNTKYYVRAYATNTAGTAYGNEISFTTSLPDPVLPTVTTASPLTSITHNSATGGGNVTSDGYATVSERGVCWNTSGNPTTGDTKLTGGTGTGAFTVSLTGLSASTTYYVRAYAINSVGTSYGAPVSFTTSVLPYTIPTLTTTAATSITNNSASTGGTISGNGGATITISGVCYGTSSNPTTAGNKTTDGTATGSFTSNLSSLSSSTSYYVRAYATNAAGTAYGNEISFTTLAPPVALPTVTTTAISGIGTTTASSGGNVTYGGTSAVTAKGICWSTTINPTTANSTTTDGSGTGAFTSSISGLTPCTTYHVRAYATNSTGTSYGSDEMFTTGTVTPSITTTGISGLTSTTANSGGTITGDCLTGVTVRGVCWSTSPGPTTGLATKTNNGTGGGSFSSSISGLTPCTLYYVRAYATNGAGTVYGNEISFTTSAVVATVSSTTITGIGTTTASSGGNVTGNCITGVTAQGIVWSTSVNPTVDLVTKTTNGTGGGSFTSSMTGLTPCTLYYVRAYATNSAGTAYGNQLTFTTSTDVSSVSTTAISGITAYTAASGGTVSGSCGVTVTARGVCWNTTGTPTTANSKTTNSSGSGSFTSSLTGLSFNTTYYVRAYATNSAGTVYGNQVSFTTSPIPPYVSTTSVGVISARSTITGGNVTSENGATVDVRGVCWNTTGSPVYTENPLTSGSGLGSYTIDITSLSAGTTYYLRAYAHNSAGYGYGSQITISVPSTVTDFDGNAYPTVSINGQTWMQANLKVSRYNDGSNLVQYSDTMSIGYSYYHYYSNNSAYGTTYGYMYNGYVVGGTKNICPVGWHVATYTDWTTLRTYLGGNTVAGGKMNDLTTKLISKFPVLYGLAYWNNSMTGHTNDSRFYARGGGYYLNSYTNLFNSTVWWISNKQYVRIDYDNTYMNTTSSTDDDNAFYIRCKKD